MILWIESQTTEVIALIVFMLSYVATATVFLLAVLLRRRVVAAHMNAPMPVVLTPLTLITGLLIAFLASRVWSNLDHAGTYVEQEASALRASILLSDSLPEGVSAAVHKSIKRYLEFIETTDWPDMAEGRANLRRVPPGLPDAMRTLLSFKPTDPGQTFAQQRAVVAIEQALGVRRSRILLSEAAIQPIQWIVIIALALLIQVTIAMVHIERPVTVAVNLFTFATALAACLTLLLVNDRPFGAGGNTVRPDVLQDVGPIQ